MNIVALLMIIAAFVLAIIGVSQNAVKWTGIAVIILAVVLALITAGSLVGGKFF